MRRIDLHLHKVLQGYWTSVPTGKVCKHHYCWFVPGNGGQERLAGFGNDLYIRDGFTQIPALLYSQQGGIKLAINFHGTIGVSRR